MHLRQLILAIALLIASTACTSDPGTPAVKADVLPPLFPDYTEVTVPANIAPLNFSIRGARALKATFTAPDGTTLTCCGKDHIDIPEPDWHSLLASARGRKLSVSVAAWTTRYPQGAAYRDFTITVQDDIDPWIVYRLIDPGYDSWGHIGIYQRNLASFDEEAIITNRDNRARCVNCHSFAGYSPDTMMFHQRSVDPATVILHDGVVDRIDLKDIGVRKAGLYCKWHPSGRYIIFSNNGTHQSFLDHGRKVLEVYDTHSSLFLYDVSHHTTTADPLLTDTAAMHTFASWSPDGRHLYYCSAPKRDGFPDASKSVRYSIVRMAFDADSGRFTGSPDTIYSAHREGHSASFPRLSPDGRHLLFVEADCGTFPVYHPEAHLQLLDLESRERIDSSVLASEESESYHAWSSSGRWIVFQSRRMDGRHTRLMLAYIGPDGTPRKPFMLPQRNPEDNLTRIWSYNVPEFVKDKVTHQFQ